MLDRVSFKNFKSLKAVAIDLDQTMDKVTIDGQPIWRPVERSRLGDRFSIEFDDGTEVPADLLSEGTVLALGLLTKLHEPAS